MSIKTKTDDAEPQIRKVWEMNPGDIVRFVLTRRQWTTLLKALAGSATHRDEDDRDLNWRAIDILQNCIEDVAASEMKLALEQIADLTKHKGTHSEQIIHCTAKRGLKGAPLDGGE